MAENEVELAIKMANKKERQWEQPIAAASRALSKEMKQDKKKIAAVQDVMVNKVALNEIETAEMTAMLEVNAMNKKANVKKQCSMENCTVWSHNSLGERESELRRQRFMLFTERWSDELLAAKECATVKLIWVEKVHTEDIQCIGSQEQ